MELCPEEEFFAYAFDKEMYYAEFALKGHIVVVAIEGESGLNCANMKYDKFRKLSVKQALKESGATKVHLWEFGINTVDALDEQPLVELNAVNH